MRKLMMAGNWKMQKTNAELPGFFEIFIQEAGLSGDQNVDVLFAAPATLLAKSVELATPTKIHIASQNVHWADAGAFTGEISVPMLREIGVGSSLIGHSERRQYFGETDETVVKRTRAALDASLLPIVCVGESLEERDAGRTEEVVRRQTEAFLGAIEAPGALVIAYEPVWAIGTGKSATPAQAQEVHAFIRVLVRERFGEEVSASMRILYGGSAKPANIEELLAQEDIDGGLVGGASLSPRDFASMVKSAESFS